MKRLNTRPINRSIQSPNEGMNDREKHDRKHGKSCHSNGLPSTQPNTSIRMFVYSLTYCGERSVGVELRAAAAVAAVVTSVDAAEAAEVTGVAVMAVAVV